MKKYLWPPAILMIIAALFLWIRPDHYFLTNRDQEDAKIESESDATLKRLSRRDLESNTSILGKVGFGSDSATGSLMSDKNAGVKKMDVNKTNSEILKTDDLCAFQNLERFEYLDHSNRSDQKESSGQSDPGVKNSRAEQIKKLYFEQSAFSKNYDDYVRYLSGEKPLSDVYTLILYHLDQAGLVARDANFKSKIRANSDEAIQGFHDLANQDPENAVFAILSLAVDNQSQEDRSRWIDKVMGSEKFNSYAIDYRLELEHAAELSAISYVVVSAYFGQLQIPDWSKIRNQLQKNLFDRPDVIRKIGVLMTKPALETKTPSWAIGFDPLEYEVGRRLIGKPYKTLNFKQLDDSRYKPQYAFDFTILGRITEHCTESEVQKVREFYAEVRQQFKKANVLY